MVKNKKKILLVLFMLALVSACGGGGGSESNNEGDNHVSPAESQAPTKPSLVDGCDKINEPSPLQYADPSLYLGQYTKVEDDNVKDTCSGYFEPDFSEIGEIMSISETKLVVNSGGKIYIFGPNNLFTRLKCSYIFIRYSETYYCAASVVSAVVDGETRDVVSITCFFDNHDSCSVGYRRKATHQF